MQGTAFENQPGKHRVYIVAGTNLIYDTANARRFD
jgi:hypothetical protein